ncbi:MAG: hypothetical protein ACE5K1_09585 [Acidiferrobacterales bacterium]
MSRKILGFALASVAAGFLTVAAPALAAGAGGCSAPHKGTKPVTAETGKPAPTQQTSETKGEKG